MAMAVAHGRGPGVCGVLGLTQSWCKPNSARLDSTRLVVGLEAGPRGDADSETTMSRRGKRTHAKLAEHAAPVSGGCARASRVGPRRYGWTARASRGGGTDAMAGGANVNLVQVADVVDRVANSARLVIRHANLGPTQTRRSVLGAVYSTCAYAAARSACSARQTLRGIASSLRGY